MTVHMIEGHDYQDAEGTFWNKAVKWHGTSPMLFEGTWTLTSARDGKERRFTSGGLDWNLGAPNIDRTTNLVADITDTPLTLNDPVFGDTIPKHEPVFIPGIYPHARYDELVKEIFDKVTELGKLKGGEYAGDLDRLANFRRNGADVGLDMEVVWRIYAGKHWDAISQYVKDLVSGRVRVRMEGLEGRAIDLIVYLILFIAMCEERENDSRKTNNKAKVND